MELVEKEREEWGNVVLLKGLGFGSGSERECVCTRVAMSL